MKLFVIAILLVAAIAFGYVFASRRNAADIPIESTEDRIAADAAPVIVELYTSEGCSSCPPADRLLMDLAGQRSDVIALSFHVDYWNSDSWKDRFSSPLFTRRQEIYASRFGLDSTYTPQMVVNGTKQFVGSDAKTALDTIDREIKAKHGTISLSSDNGKVLIDAKDMPGAEQSTVYLAVTETGLSSDIGGGENRGVTLFHPPVVRRLATVGVLERKQTSLKATVDLPSDPSWKTENLSYVVFVQENTSRRIDAAARIR